MLRVAIPGPHMERLLCGSPGKMVSPRSLSVWGPLALKSVKTFRESTLLPVHLAASSEAQASPRGTLRQGQTYSLPLSNCWGGGVFAKTNPKHNVLVIPFPEECGPSQPFTS